MSGLAAYQIHVPETQLTRIGSPFMRGQYDRARFFVPQGQKFPGMSGMGGQYDAANFYVPQGQTFPCNKVVTMPTPGPVNPKVKNPGRRGGMHGQFRPATWTKPPYFAGGGMGQTLTADVTNMVTQNPLVSIGIAAAAGYMLAKAFKR